MTASTSATRESQKRQDPLGVSFSRRERLRHDLETFGDLFFIQFAAVRTGWQWYFLVSSIIPLGTLFFISVVSPSAKGSDALYYVTGNAVVALVFSTMGMLSGQLAYFKQNKLFDFYAGLPVSRAGVMLATVAVSALFAIPGMILLLILGALLFHIGFSPNVLIVLVMLLAPLTMSGIGAMIGVLSPNQQVAGVITNLALVVVMFLSPVLVPASALPGMLRVTGVILPPSYAADALRRTLLGQLNSSLLLDIAFMILFAAGSIYLVTARLDWRSR